MYKIVEFSHLLIKNFIQANLHDKMTLIDATCGRGNDTIYMAELISDAGHVYSYDIQDVAIEYTKSLLSLKKINNVTLKLCSHEFIQEDDFDLAIFNLGYLPLGDKFITTTHETSLLAIQNLIYKMDKLNHNALIIIAVYVGHEEGLKESQVIDSYVQNLSSKDYLVTKFMNYNRPTSPFILTISKNIMSSNKVKA